MKRKKRKVVILVCLSMERSRRDDLLPTTVLWLRFLPRTSKYWSCVQKNVYEKKRKLSLMPGRQSMNLIVRLIIPDLLQEWQPKRRLEFSNDQLKNVGFVTSSDGDIKSFEKVEHIYPGETVPR